ncbi:hypothetical protein BRADI_4g12816v3 [Brachypodium distachyon]|uniref:DUF7952 domain-containing protein n=1 Tax=Brachypodium distachyon TaxID=15368 RepID=A0A0Q3EIW1_BRADI|nr:hypothetical protein BRADI_4g12816v3 [Brachypodium distachyon]
MDPVKINDGKGHLVEMLVDKPCFLEPICAEDINEDTRVYPRVGDEYQVEIANLATEEEQMELRSSPAVDSRMFGFEYPVAVGLTIPVSWTQNTNTRMEEEKANPNDYVPVPGMPMYSWTDEEAQTFLLSRYIFGKNLTMGEVLSYYYGEVFRSDGYNRWVACRKVTSRRCIGSPIFSGPRQQELLSRFLAAVAREARDALLEVFKKFNEGTSDFEQFILCLRSTVGAQVLVEAVGIGKGKYDLTGFPLDPSRKHGMSARTEQNGGDANFPSIVADEWRMSNPRSHETICVENWMNVCKGLLHGQAIGELNYPSNLYTDGLATG